MEIYLDNSATTPVCTQAVQAMMNAVTDNYGNPSAVHSKGVRAKQLLESSRARAAAVLSCEGSEIYFSHSGTEANNAAIFGAVQAKKRLGNRIVTTSLEHPSVMRCMEELQRDGFEVIKLPCRYDGTFSRDDLFSAVNKNTILVSTMLVNNELGSINPVELALTAVKKASAPALIHTDAIQAFGKMPVKPLKLGVDLLTASGHKIHGPKGVGLLYMRKGVSIKPRVLGGGQEGNLFSGTEPMPAIAGFAAALEALPDEKRSLEEMKILRNSAVEKLMKISGVEINSPKDALPYILNISVTGIPSQVLINFLSERAIYISAGSACKKGHRSEVLSVIGLPPARIDSAVRISFSRFTNEGDTDALAEGINAAVNSLRTKL